MSDAALTKYYYNTKDAIQVGDRVLVKRLLFGEWRAPKTGVMDYIPDSEGEVSGLGWVICFDDGISSLCLGNEFRINESNIAPPSVSLVRRGAPRDQPSASHSRYFYHGTEIEICLGDVVDAKRFLFGSFRKPRRGTICYIDGISPPRRDLKNSIAIRYNDAFGSISAFGYAPRQLRFATASVLFVSRGAPAPLREDEVGDGEGYDEDEEERLDMERRGETKDT